MITDDIASLLPDVQPSKARPTFWPSGMLSRIALVVFSYSVARSRRSVETDGRLTSGFSEKRIRRNSGFVIVLNGIKADKNPRSR